MDDQVKQAYGAPVLKPKEIISCLACLQIPCTADDLKSPQPQRVMQMYESFLEILSGYSKENMAVNGPNFSVIEILEYPELHNESLVLLGFYRKL